MTSNNLFVKAIIPVPLTWSKSESLVYILFNIISFNAGYTVRPSHHLHFKNDRGCIVKIVSKCGVLWYLNGLKRTNFTKIKRKTKLLRDTINLGIGNKTIDS